MTLRRRLSTVALLALLALSADVAARYFSTPLVVYVVEQALVQKAPAGMDSAVLHNRFRKFLSSASQRGDMLEELLVLSRGLEKTQQLSSVELGRMLKEDGNAF